MEIVIVGSVTDESGAAVTGAKLWLPVAIYDDRRVAEATTNEAGTFTLRVPTAWTSAEAHLRSGSIWCYARDRQIAAVSAWQQLWQQSHSPIKIILKPKSDTGFIVKDGGGDPIAGARVEPWHFLVGSYDILPRQLRDVIAQVTDKDGRVFFPEMGRDGFFTVQVTAKGYGIQQLRLKDRATEAAVRTIALRPVGRLEGWLVCDDKAAFKSAHVYICTKRISMSAKKRTSGDASIEVREDGRFIVPEFAYGAIDLIITVDQSLTVRPRIPQNIEILAGETTYVRVPFEKTVRVRGRVQTKGDGVPVAGALVSVRYGSFRQGDHVLTDADGRFEANVLAGKVYRQLIDRTEKYSHWMVEEADWNNKFNIPAGVKTFDLPPLELTETFERAGRLVDRSSRAVARADIRAITGNRIYAWGESDKDGNFHVAIAEVVQDRELRCPAHAGF